MSMLKSSKLWHLLSKISDPCRSQTLFEQTFVDIAFGIGRHAGRVLGVGQLDVQAAECGGVWVSCRAFLKIAPSIPDFLPALEKPVHRESCGSVVRVLRRRDPASWPNRVLWARRSFVVRRFRLLVGHFQKEQKRDLLGVSHVGKPIS